MALPPTHIYKYIKETPEETFRSLKKAGLFTKASKSKKHEIIAELNNAKKDYLNDTSDNTGPNLEDITAETIYKHLNRFGQKLANTEIYSSTKIQKISITIRKPLYRLKALLGL